MVGITASCTEQWERSAIRNLVEDGAELVIFGVTNYTHSVSRSEGFAVRLEDSDHLKNILFGLDWVKIAKQ